MATYHTEGIIKEVELTQTDGTFTIEAVPPYLIDEKNAGLKEKSILFIEDSGDDPASGTSSLVQEASEADEALKKLPSEPKNILRNAFLISARAKFTFACANKQINASTLILLKQNRSKLKISINGSVASNVKDSSVPTILVDAIVIK